MVRVLDMSMIEMSGHSTAQAANMIGVSKSTLLRWLHDGLLREPKRSRVGGVTWRMWSKKDIERARRFKATMKRGPKPKRRSKSK